MQIELLDSTLREGEQSPTVSFTIEQKIEIAKQLDEFGVEYIELGHPAVSPDVRKAIGQLAKLDTKANKLLHGRALKADIDDAVQFGVEWLGIFFGTSDLSLEYKFQINRREALKRIKESVEYAKDKNLKLRFTAEDATRTDPAFLLEVAHTAEEAGADRFSVADTVGTIQPRQMTDLISSLKKSINIPVHIHCHNDFGLANANSLAALDGGARVADVTVNGLGERCGIATLAEVALVLKLLYKVENPWKLELLPQLSQMVERFSGVFNSENKPLVGMHAFTHKAGLHTRAVLKDPRTYEAFPPELIRRHREITIDKFTGKDAVLNRLQMMSVKVNDEQLGEIIRIIKSKPDKRQFTDIDLLEIADDVLGIEVQARVPLKVEAIVSMGLSSALYTTRITRRLLGFSQVKNIFEVTGKYDIIAHLETNTTEELNDLIEDIRASEGVINTNTKTILKGFSRPAESSMAVS